jgi:hypothetical protein
MNKELYQPINVGDTIIPWKTAAKAEGAKQMVHLKNLMLSRPYTSRIADQSIIKSTNGNSYVDLICATRDENKSYAMIYLPQNKSVRIDLNKISGTSKNVWWFDPRTGKATAGKQVKSGTHDFSPPENGQDWVLVIDDASKNFKAPGVID